MKAVEAIPLPTCIAWKTVPSLRRPITRSIHPVRSDVPGAARSISSIAEKCERFGSDIPTACTKPSNPESYSGLIAPNAGCRPNIGSLSDSSVDCGIPTWVRQFR